MPFREMLKQISPAYKIQAAKTAADLFIQQAIFKKSEHIACYFSFKDEFDALPIMEAIWQAKKHCYLPVLTQENSLRFIRYNKGDALKSNRYAIFEPVNDTVECKPQDLDIVITPLIAFDLRGRRLGTGGGYYDRTFAFLHKESIKRPLIIGLAYAAQEAADVPHDTWDVNLDGVQTEKEFILFTDS